MPRVYFLAGFAVLQPQSRRQSACVGDALQSRDYCDVVRLGRVGDRMSLGTPYEAHRCQDMLDGDRQP